MTNERKERIIFMPEGIERSEPRKVSLEHPEREAKRSSGESKDTTRYGRKQQAPEGKSTPPAPLNEQVKHEGSGNFDIPVKDTNEADAPKDEEPHFPTAPEKVETPEEQAERERQEKLFEHITEGRHEDAFKMMMEDTGRDPEEEFKKPEVQKSLHDIKSFTEEMQKPEEERDLEKLEEAAQAFKGSPKHMQEYLRAALGAHGMSEEQVKKILPDELAAPTEGGEDEDGITAPTEGEPQLTEEEQKAKDEVMPFVQRLNEAAGGGKPLTDDEKERFRDKLKKVPWLKIGGRSLQAIFYTAMAAYVAYVFLMAKTSGIGGKK